MGPGYSDSRKWLPKIRLSEARGRRENEMARNFVIPTAKNGYVHYVQITITINSQSDSRT